MLLIEQHHLQRVLGTLEAAEASGTIGGEEDTAQV
jgi:hypothetical protein